MKNHSPGPWSLRKREFAPGTAFRPEYYAVMDPEGILVAEVHTAAHTCEEFESNAHLIAAAPEMLRALVLLLAEAESLRESYSAARVFEGWDAIEEDPCFALAREAIAKALSETTTTNYRR